MVCQVGRLTALVQANKLAWSRCNFRSWSNPAAITVFGRPGPSSLVSEPCAGTALDRWCRVLQIILRRLGRYGRTRHPESQSCGSYHTPVTPLAEKKLAAPLSRASRRYCCRTCSIPSVLQHKLTPRHHFLCHTLKRGASSPSNPQLSDQSSSPRFSVVSIAPNGTKRSPICW
jgi:hypothetical protein